MAEPPRRPPYTQVSRAHKGVDAQVRRQERRHKLIEAGLETLGTKGYHNTTVRDVCGAAGLSERYFYESFTGLAELFDTVYQGLHIEWLGRLMGIFVAARGKPADPLQTAEQALTAWLDYLREDPRRARIIMVDAMGVNEQTGRGAQAAARDYVGAIQTLIELLYPQLERHGLSPRMIASLITGACILIVKDWVMSDFAAPQQTIVTHVLFMFRGLDSQYPAHAKKAVVKRCKP